MRIRQMGHACLRLENRGKVLVIDPGEFSSPDALDGADAVLVTHEHFDHLAVDRLRAAASVNPGLRIWTNTSVANLLNGTNVYAVGAGDTLSIDGAFDVNVEGEWHAIIHPDIPRVLNIAFLVNGLVFHPGDSFTLPQHAVDTLMLPVSAPWLKISEVIDYVRAVKPCRALPVHDAILSEFGLDLVDGLLGERGPGINAEYRRPAPAEWIELD